MKSKTFKCVICKEKRPAAEMTKPPASLRYVCKPHIKACMATLSIQLREKQKDAKFKEKKKAYKETKIATRKRAAKEACHAYIRERDKYQPCICCGRPLGESYDAGHFLESGNYSYVRYDEDNIHAQRADCNRHKGGDSGEYEIRLRAKIGDARVDRLHEIKRVVKRHSVDELREIEAYYKCKLNEITEGAIQ